MAQEEIIHIHSVTEYCRLRGLPAPEHPLITVVDYAKANYPEEGISPPIVTDYYSIAIKRGVGKLFYGQQVYDFDEGVMYCMAPKQVLRVQTQANTKQKRSGWILLIHPDFLWGSDLAKKIKQYAFFDYSVNEALFLSEKEEQTINQIINSIRQEYSSSIDAFSQNIIISHIETLLNYTERFYQRQFITRKITNHKVLEQTEQFLSNYFENTSTTKNGLPTVQSIASALNMSPGYLSSVLKTLTGQSAQQHIHEKLIQKAKEKLSTESLSVSEIAFQLGFEHSQSFSKFFKLKTGQSPVAFRQRFN